MKQFYLKCLFLGILSLTGVNTFAYDCKVDGIYYNLNTTAKTASVTNLYNSIFKNDAYIGSVTIPSSFIYNGTQYVVNSIGDFAFFACNRLTSVTIPNSVTSIGESAFDSCTGLSSIIIPNSVTTIGEDAFNYCTGLSSIIIPSSVTTIGRDAFSGCSGLKSVTIPSSVTSIKSGAFSGCSGLTSISIPSSVTSIGILAFQNCISLSSVTINSNTILSKDYSSSSNLKEIFGNQVTNYVLGTNLTSIGKYAFYGCEKLTSLEIPNSVTSVGSSAFEGCSGLTSITIPNRVVSIEASTFAGCSGLTSVSIPSSVTSIANSAFEGCSGLTSITIPNRVVSIEASTFAGCSGLTSIIIPSNVTNIANSAFSGCGSLSFVTINSNTILSKDYSSSSNLKSIFGSQVTKYILGENVTSIGKYAFYGCEKLASIEIPITVTSIGNSAFSGCGSLSFVTINSNTILSKDYSSSSNLKSIFGSQVTKYVLGENVTSIGKYAFARCSGLTSITVPSSVTSIGDLSFSDCSNLKKVIVNDIAAWCKISFSDNPLKYAHHLYSDEDTEITTLTIPNIVTSIGMNAFSSCSGLTSVIIPNSVTSIGMSAFSGCSGLTSVTISNSMNRIDSSTFKGCGKLTSITIPNSVTSIGESAFYGCTGLTTVSIGNSVTNIEKEAFYNCGNLDLVTINSNIILSKDYTSSSNIKNIFGNQVSKYVIGADVTSIGSYAFYGCGKLTSITIPNSVTTIGRSVFYGCSGLTSVTIGNSVTTIGEGAFSGCSGLTSVTIGHGVTSIEQNTFWGCSGLISVTIPNSVTTIGQGAFYGCSSLTSAIIPNSVTTIGQGAFQGCSNLTSVTIPNSVTSIGNSAFQGCSSLTSVTMGNNVTKIEKDTFPYTAKILVNNGTKSLITLWNNNYSAYNISTGEHLPPSTISLVSSAQTSVTVTVADYYDGYTYAINDEKVNKGEEKTFSGINHFLTLRISLDDISYSKDFSFKSKGLDLNINAGTTSSSINVVCSYTHGDAVVTSEEIYVNGKKVSDGNTYYISGLDPNTTYTIMYSTNFESISEYVRTAPLILTTSQPKVISSGNVIVAAETNLDNEETNVGFEWRRTDWTNDFTSNSGAAYLYNGTMEGYIRNLNTEKLWKYRPYYTSNAGKSYYGEWVGIDPTNTSYFEPTVHTYANVSVNGNSAEVKGYVQRGTDNVVSKGFAYWKQSEGVKAREAKEAVLSMISILPSNAKTVEVSGSQQVMTASISNLEYETTYCYVAFVRTSEGDTFYGEPREFTTDIDVTGIRDVDYNKTVTVIQRYDQNGLRISSPRRGLNILLMSDGSTKKVWVK